MVENIILSIVVPVFNEEENIELLFERINSVVKESYEIIFVDDGSSDSSLSIFKKLSNDNP